MYEEYEPVAIAEGTRLGRCSTCHRLVDVVRHRNLGWIVMNHGPLVNRCHGSGQPCEGVLTVNTNDARSDVDKAVYERFVANAEADDKEREIQRKLEIAQRFGEDRYEDGQVLSFQRTVQAASKSAAGLAKVLDYAAIKADGRWWLTGSTHAAKPFAWRQLVAWLVSGRYPVQQMNVLITKSRIGTADHSVSTAPDPWASTSPAPATLDEEPPF